MIAIKCLPILVVLISFQNEGVKGGSSMHLKQCPPMCICGGAERYVLCTEKNIYHVPFPLPNGTEMLGLSKNEFTSLSPNTFKDVLVNSTLESLIFYDNKIKTIQPKSFQRLGKLKNLWLFGNRLTQLKANTFLGLEELVDLDLSRNELAGIQNNAFAGLKNLQVLQLWGNSLKILELHSFFGLENLCNLTLGDNKFNTIPTNTFQHLHNLTTLELLNLPVENIEANAFSSLKKLEKLHIGDWPLLHGRIDEQSFSDLPFLTYLSLYGCNLNTVPRKALAHLTSLKQLLLNNNPNIISLSEKDFASLHNLEELYLSNTGTHTIHESPFVMLSKLKTLDLSQNNISVLPSHIFLQLENLRLLNLSHNQLKELSPTAFVTLTRISTIDLSKNELICDCDIKWLKSLQELKIREHFTLNAKCSDPVAYSGIDIIALAPERFVCEAPSFSEEDTTLKVETKIGENISLSCFPNHGVPTPKMKWKKVDQNNLKSFKVLKNGTLVIEHVRDKDAGIYVCNAVNKFGEASARITLKIDHESGDSNKSSTEVTTGITVTLVLLFILALAYFLHKRCRNKNVYGSMNNYDDSQRLSLKNGLKLS